jgi:hypothetical protein
MHSTRSRNISFRFFADEPHTHTHTNTSTHARTAYRRSIPIAHNEVVSKSAAAFLTPSLRLLPPGPPPVSNGFSDSLPSATAPPPPPAYIDAHGENCSDAAWGQRVMIHG